MSKKLVLTRRGLIGGAAATLAAPYIIRPSFAQISGEIIQCNFGGGVAEMVQKAYGDLFTAATGIPFRVVEVPSTETALVSNAAAPIYNSSYHSYAGAMKLYNMGITEPLAIADYPILQDIPQHLLPMVDDNHIAGMPLNFIFYGLAYNTEFAQAADFRSWHALTDARWAGQTTVTAPVYASLYDVPWYSRMLTGDQRQTDAGIEHYKAVTDNALTAYTSMAQNQQLLQRGDSVACAFYSSRVWDMKVNGVENVNIVIPDEGALMIPYVFVLPKNAPYQEAAREFIGFAGTPEPQEQNMLFTGTIPANATANVDNNLLMERFGMTREEIVEKTFNPDWAYIEETRDDVIRRLEAEIR